MSDQAKTRRRLQRPPMRSVAGYCFGVALACLFLAIWGSAEFWLDKLHCGGKPDLALLDRSAVLGLLIMSTFTACSVALAWMPLALVLLTLGRTAMPRLAVSLVGGVVAAACMLIAFEFFGRLVFPDQYDLTTLGQAIATRFLYAAGLGLVGGCVFWAVGYRRAVPSKQSIAQALKAL